MINVIFIKYFAMTFFKNVALFILIGNRIKNSSFCTIFYKELCNHFFEEKLK